MTTQPSDWAVARALELLSARPEWGYGRLRAPIILIAEVMELARELDASGDAQRAAEAGDTERLDWIERTYSGLGTTVPDVVTGRD